MGKLLLRSGKDPWTVISPRATYRRNVLGTNAGNLLFSSSVHRTLTTRDVKIVSNRWRINPDLAGSINEEYDGFVVPLANAFRLSYAKHLAALTELVSRLTIPVIVVGVGAQTAIDGNPARLAPIDDTVKSFVAAVLDRSATFGVRGEFTADYLRALGFSDVEVIGCPSMYLWGDDLAVDRQLPALDASAKLSMSVSPYVKALGPIVRHHHEAYPDLTYVAQDNATLRKLVRGTEPEDADKDLTNDIPIYLTHPLFREDKVRLFVDPWTWIDYLRERDFSFGSRLHGSIAAILAGTPAFLLVHDSRTLELARYHELPHRMIRETSPDVDARDLYAEADFAGARRGHAARFATYLAFLERNGLAHAYQAGESRGAFDHQVAAAAFPAAVRLKQPKPPEQPKPSTPTSPSTLRAQVRRVRRKLSGSSSPD